MPFVSLTFDDALPEHLDVVAPLLKQHRMLATFYVHLSSPTIVNRTAEWQQLAEAGHELGNHTIFHPALSSKSWVTAANAIDDYSVERMTAELLAANDWLKMIDGRSCRSFAYPCSNPVVGRPGIFRRLIRNTRLERTRLANFLDVFPGPGNTQASYQQAAGAIFTACRGGGLTLESQPPHFSKLDFSMLPSVSIEAQPLDDIFRFVRNAVSSGAWPILQFHSVGGSHGQNCSPAALQQIVEWLTKENIPAKTISQGVACLRQAPAASVAKTSLVPHE